MWTLHDSSLSLQSKVLVKCFSWLMVTEGFCSRQANIVLTLSIVPDPPCQSFFLYCYFQPNSKWMHFFVPASESLLFSFPLPDMLFSRLQHGLILLIIKFTVLFLKVVFSDHSLCSSLTVRYKQLHPSTCFISFCHILQAFFPSLQSCAI